MFQPEHEKLEVYHRALAIVTRAEAIARAVGDGDWDIRDQLKRAAGSIVHNIAEGASEFAPSEKARFYRFARRSGGECLAALDVIRARGLLVPGLDEIRAEILAVMDTLNKIVFAMQRRRQRP